MDNRSKCCSKKLLKAKRNYSCQNVILGQVIINNRGLSISKANKGKKNKMYHVLVGRAPHRDFFGQNQELFFSRKCALNLLLVIMTQLQNELEVFNTNNYWVIWIKIIIFVCQSKRRESCYNLRSLLLPI